ncbi:AAA-like domain-containing protein [Myxacorys almedinensis]|uniref:Helix-turn-helix domain-containing protein n=1 Tax=Myxacorys almedinensis A TaxID=2690445 RepID=A0A8J8CIK5_9CYAN|nr:AAA-like domain-containing protein [Myxacorys almedinensis]NDJ17779.1 helix-turn-helix domain-containing protein [Myxacorys almedinensis A]
MSKKRETDSVQATAQGIRRVRDRVRDRILRERQQRREQHLDLSYTREELAVQAGISIDTLKRLLRGVNVRRDSAEAIARFLELQLADLIEPNDHQRPSDSYVERPPFEAQCYDTIFSQSSALVRVKAPHRMGKTWFVEHLLNQGQAKCYQSVTLSFRDADRAVFADLQTFLKWFCISVGNSLERPNQLEEKWQADLGNNSNCTNYFETCLWSGLDTPLVLVLDDVDLVFEQHDIADDFCKLLRSWYDRARRVRGSAWRNLRLVIVHSTDIYGALDINYSPLANVGTVFSLRTFYLREAAELVQRYAVDWQADQIKQMMELIGGNPYLIHEALDYLKLHPEMSLEQFLHSAATEIGPYHNYLGELLSTLQQNSNLAMAFKSIVNSTVPTRVEPAFVFQLYGMGLVEVEEKGVVPSCELYRRYFRDRL